MCPIKTIKGRYDTHVGRCAVVDGGDLVNKVPVAPSERGRHGNSLSEELREMLTREAVRPSQETAARLQALRDESYAECGVPDSTPFIGAERDRRE